MASLTKLKQELAAAREEAEKLVAVQEQDDIGEELMSDIESQTDAALDRCKDLLAKIEKQQAIQDKLNSLTPDEPANEVQLDQPADAHHIVKIPATAIEHRCKFLGRDEHHGMSPEHRAYAFGQFMFATAAATEPGKFGHLKKHIKTHEDRFGPMAAATEGGNAGVWVPTQFGADIASLAERWGIVRSLFNNKTMTTDKRTDPKEGSDPTPVFVGEGVEGTDNTPTDDSTITLTAKKLMGIFISSSELNEDSMIEYGENMLVRMARGFAKKEDQCGFIGDGTSTYGGMKGLHTKLQDIDGAGTDAAGLITGTAGSGAAWSSFTRGDLEAVVAQLPDFADSGPEDSPAAVWVCHRAFYYNVMVSLLQAAGGTPGSEIVDGFRRPVFMGWPVRFSNACPKTATTTQVVATFGDHRMAADFGSRRMYTVEFSREATIGSVNLFSSDQIAAKATERFDINVHSLGDATNAGHVVGLETAGS